MITRTEYWTKDGQTAVIEVDHCNCVTFSYELLEPMLREFGFVKQPQAGTDG